MGYSSHFGTGMAVHVHLWRLKYILDTCLGSRNRTGEWKHFFGSKIKKKKTNLFGDFIEIELTYFGYFENRVNIFGVLRKWTEIITPVINNDKYLPRCLKYAGPDPGGVKGVRPPLLCRFINAFLCKYLWIYILPPSYSKDAAFGPVCVCTVVCTEID